MEYCAEHDGQPRLASSTNRLATVLKDATSHVSSCALMQRRRSISSMNTVGLAVRQTQLVDVHLLRLGERKHHRGDDIVGVEHWSLRVRLTGGVRDRHRIPYLRVGCRRRDQRCTHPGLPELGPQD